MNWGEGLRGRCRLQGRSQSPREEIGFVGEKQRLEEKPKCIVGWKGRLVLKPPRVHPSQWAGCEESALPVTTIIQGEDLGVREHGWDG